MPHFKKRFPSEHLEAADLDGREVTIKILKIESTTMDGDKPGAPKQHKGLIHFEGKKKTTWVYPVTVGRCLRAMFGDDDDKWIGKRVTIHSEKVEAFGDMEDAVRPIGSPDIDKPITFKVRKGRGKVTMTMRPTGTAKAPSSPATPPETHAGEQVPPPPDDDRYNESERP